jgi:hypothetical protein
MWESPEELWRRLALGREEYLQRILTTLIVGGEPPGWNTPTSVSGPGRTFLRLLDELAHDPDHPAPDAFESFVDEYLLPKLDEQLQNGWPDWAVLWPDRVWIIELKTEAGSHRTAQLPYYLQLAAAAHPHARLDLTYITGPLEKPAPTLLPGQRYRHVTWEQVLPLIDVVWGQSSGPMAAYVDMVRTIIQNLTLLRPSEQRAKVIGVPAAASAPVPASDALLNLARGTVMDGQQRAVGASSPTVLEALRDEARSQIAGLPADDGCRFVLPWLWTAGKSGGQALTQEGAEFGYELRFSRYATVQVPD